MLTFLLSSGNVIVFSQQQKIDSLRILLHAATADTNRVNTLNALAEEYKNKDPDSAINFANEASVIAQKLDFKMGIADAALTTARATANLGRTNEGLRNCFNALEIYKHLSALKSNVSQSRVLQQTSNAENTKGVIYLMQGDYPEALKSLFSALSLKEKTGDQKGIANAENNIGTIYFYQRNFPESLKHYFIALKIRIGLRDTQGTSGTYNNIGLVFMEQGNYNEALRYYRISLELAEQAGDKRTMADIYSNTGFVETKHGNYEAAVYHLRLAIKFLKQTGNRDGLVAAYTNIGHVFIKQKKFANATHYLRQALAMAKDMNGLLRMKEVYAELTVLDSAQGNFEEAYKHHKMFVHYRDSMFNNENAKKLMLSQLQFDFDKKESLAEAERNRQVILKEVELNNHKATRNLSFAGIAVVLLFSGYGFYRYRQNEGLSKRLASSLVELEQAQTQLIKTEKEKEAENVRVQISRDIHDEVGATLSGIALFSEIARQKIKNTEDKDLQGYLENITVNSREMIDKMSEIVWTINPQNDSFDRIISKLQAFAVNICAGKGIKPHLVIDKSIHKYYPGMQVRKNLYLILKEAINNAVKYSGAKNIYVALNYRDNEIAASVKDDGNGFDFAAPTEGNGLNNMKARSNELNAELDIESEKGKGVTIALKMKFHPNGVQGEVK